MKVLQLAQKPQRRGAEIFARQLGDWLASAGHQVHHAYLYRYEGDKPLLPGAGDVAFDHPQNSPLERLPFGNPALLADLRRTVAELRPDVIQANGGRSVKYAALLTFSRHRDWKLVYRNIDSPVFWVRGILRKLYMRHLVMPRLDAVVGVSRRTLDEVYGFYNLSAPGAFIPNGIDLAPLADPPPRDEVRRMTGTPEDAVVLLFFGALTAQKRPERFIRLVHRLRAEGNDRVVGWILGDGPDRAALEAQAAELGLTTPALRFLGYRENVAGPVAAADVFVSTSDSEGIPAAVLEAGYLRLPVVAFDVGGMDECVIHGDTGLLAPAGDEAALLRLTADLVADAERRRRLGNAARRFVIDHFSMESVGRRYAALYRRVLDGTAPAGRFELTPEATGNRGDPGHGG